MVWRIVLPPFSGLNSEVLRQAEGRVMLVCLHSLLFDP
jgi:hypothetical protein